MTASTTIWIALDLFQSPSNIKRLRGATLPTDVSTLLQIAAGDEEVAGRAAAATRRSPNSLREAAGFYIEQILLYPDADYYRVLGARPDASTAELRRNMALLIRWLHPDQQNGGERSIFVTRVTKAWGELKTEDKRAAYDLSRRRSQEKKAAATNGSSTRHPKSSTQAHRGRNQRSPIRDSSILMRVLVTLFGRTHH